MAVWIILMFMFILAFIIFIIIEISSFIEDGEILPLILPIVILSVIEVYNVFFIPDNAPLLLYILLNILSIFFLPTLVVFLILVINKLGIKL